MYSPKQSHMEATLRVVRYVKGSAGLGLFMPSTKVSSLVAYCDSDWGACVETRRSVTGYIVKIAMLLCHGNQRSKAQFQEILQRRN